jgi:hypothetical protein
MKIKTILLVVARFVAAAIMLQTLVFKFTASEESVYIFTQVGMEPWGRIGIGVAELIAAALLLYKTFSWMGALLSAGLMVGAIGMHLTILGIEVKGDGGYLFFLAVVVLLCSLVVLLFEREKLLLFFIHLKAKLTR